MLNVFRLTLIIGYRGCKPPSSRAGYSPWSVDFGAEHRYSIFSTMSKYSMSIQNVTRPDHSPRVGRNSRIRNTLLDGIRKSCLKSMSTYQSRQYVSYDESGDNLSGDIPPNFSYPVIPNPREVFRQIEWRAVPLQVEQIPRPTKGALDQIVLAARRASGR